MTVTDDPNARPPSSPIARELARDPATLTTPIDRMHLIALVVDGWHDARIDLDNEEAVVADTQERLGYIAEIAAGSDERVIELWREVFASIAGCDVEELRTVEELRAEEPPKTEGS